MVCTGSSTHKLPVDLALALDLSLVHFFQNSATQLGTYENVWSPNRSNYIDDLIYCGLPSKIDSAYQFLIELLQELGLDISPKNTPIGYYGGLLRYPI